jgi:hypothetical protein
MKNHKINLKIPGKTAKKNATKLKLNKKINLMNNLKIIHNLINKI